MFLDFDIYFNAIPLACSKRIENHFTRQSKSPSGRCSERLLWISRTTRGFAVFEGERKNESHKGPGQSLGSRVIKQWFHHLRTSGKRKGFLSTYWLGLVLTVYNHTSPTAVLLLCSQPLGNEWCWGLFLCHATVMYVEARLRGFHLWKEETKAGG